MSQDQQNRTPVARLKKSFSLGWVWAVPLAALGFVVWLAVRSWVFGGTEVVVSFPSAEGISATGTAVRYKGVKVGQVEKVTLTEDMEEVQVKLSIQSTASDHLRSGTQFWVVQPSLSTQGISSILGGGYIAMSPGKGEKQTEFEGRLRAPYIEPTEPGQNFEVTVSELGGLEHGSQVYYKGIEVGEVIGFKEDKADGLTLYVFVRAPYSSKVHPETVFWRDSGISIQTGNGVNMTLPPFERLLGKSIAFANPGLVSEQPITKETRFRLFENEQVAKAALQGRTQMYVVHFPGSIDGLKAGASVVYQGIRVGRVNRLDLSYNEDEGRLTTPVYIELDASRMGLSPARGPASIPITEFEQALKRMVDNGLRAQIRTDNLILGSKKVALNFVENAPEANVEFDQEVPEFPAVSGGGLDEIIASVSQITEKIENLPLQKTVQELQAVAESIRQVAESPELKNSLDRLADSLANIEELTGTAEKNLGPTLASLKQGAEDLADVAHQIRRVSGGTVRQNEDIPELIHELTEAARAVGALADYLNRHPEALIQGREKR